MVRPQLIPVFFTFAAAYFHSDPAARLHLFAVLLAKPLLALIVAALLLFVVNRSADICHSLLLGPSYWTAFAAVAALPRRPFPWRIQRIPVLPETPDLRPLFQRPPPAVSR